VWDFVNLHAIEQTQSVGRPKVDFSTDGDLARVRPFRGRRHRDARADRDQRGLSLSSLVVVREAQRARGVRELARRHAARRRAARAVEIS